MSDEKNTIGKQEQVLTEQASSEITDLDLDQAVGGAGISDSPPEVARNIRIDSENRIVHVRKLHPDEHDAYLKAQGPWIDALSKDGYSIEYDN